MSIRTITNLTKSISIIVEKTTIKNWIYSILLKNEIRIHPCQEIDNNFFLFKCSSGSETHINTICLFIKGEGVGVRGWPLILQLFLFH